MDLHYSILDLERLRWRGDSVGEITQFRQDWENLETHLSEEVLEAQRLEILLDRMKESKVLERKVDEFTQYHRTSSRRTVQRLLDIIDHYLEKMKLKANNKKKRETSWCGTYMNNTKAHATNFAMAVKHGQPICPYWMKGDCLKKDDNCPYAHPADCQGCALGNANAAKGDPKGGKKGKGKGESKGKGGKDTSGKGGKKGKPGPKGGGGKGKTNQQNDKSQIPCKNHAWTNHCAKKNDGCLYNHSFPGGQGMPSWAPEYLKKEEKQKFPNGFKKQGPQDGKGKPPGKGPKGKGKGKHGKTNHALVAGGEPEAESSPLKDQSGDPPKKTRKQRKAEKADAAAKAKAKAKAKA